MPNYFLPALYNFTCSFFSGLENKSHFISKINRVRSFLLHYGSHINWNWTYLCFLHTVFLVFINVCPSFLLVRCAPPPFKLPPKYFSLSCSTVENNLWVKIFSPWFPSLTFMGSINNNFLKILILVWAKKSSLRKCSCFFLDTTQC